MPHEMPRLVSWKFLFPRKILHGTTRGHTCKCEAINERYCITRYAISCNISLYHDTEEVIYQYTQNVHRCISKCKSKEIQQVWMGILMNDDFMKSEMVM